MGTDEFELVREAFATNWIAPVGPHVDAFEREFAAVVGAKHAVAVSSGTAALHLGLRMLDLKPGDEVFCSDLTFAASANPIVYERAQPVFIDCDRASWNMDPDLLAEALADRARRGKAPKAVVLVHLYGQSADIDRIAALCAHYDVPLIEDAAEALGARYHRRESNFTGGDGENGGERTKRTNASDGSVSSVFSCERSIDSKTASQCGVVPGTRGVLGIYSFNGNKIITTSGGGMLVTNDAALAAQVRFLSTQARDPAPHYEHSQIGFNYRMSNVLAGIGRGQLRVLEQRVDARRANCAFYQEAFADLPGIEFMPEAAFGRATRWLTCVTIDPEKFGANREDVGKALEAENIEARPVWKPMHLQPVFAECACFGGAVSEDLFARGLCLPSGSSLTGADLQRVVETVRECSLSVSQETTERTEARP
jgi:pyridoxal phosphate-dependent aminotransferase EpsN